MFYDVERVLEGPCPVAEKLYRFAVTVTRLICSDPVIRAQRTVIGVSERMPELGARFYERGGQRGNRILRRFLDEEVARGTLAIEDVALAAYQFSELAMAGIFRRRLFGHMADPPTEAELDRSARAAVAVFLSAYGIGQGA